jgi:diadenosine tetraphosphate (Ap4A) HIT family hydrolase
MPSPFQDIPETEWIASNDLAFAVRDRFAVSPGQTLVVSRREIPTYFDATDAQKRSLWALVEEVKASLDREMQPEGYNVGFNAGPAAGQTAMHLHVHVIPRSREMRRSRRAGSVT